jgi:hypothetical protein
MDDPDQIACLRRVAEQGVRYQPNDEGAARRLRMMTYQMLDKTGRGGGATLLSRLEKSPGIRQELRELADVLETRSQVAPRPLPGFPEIPLCLHAAYGRREILSALGLQDDGEVRLSNAGVEWAHSAKLGIFFVTLDKTTGFRGRIAFHDCALSPEQFQWQSQAATTPTSEVGHRYLEAPQNGWRFLLFVQDRKGDPFRAMGPLTHCLEHHGTKPMTMIWHLAERIPQALFQRWSPAR